MKIKLMYKYLIFFGLISFCISYGLWLEKESKINQYLEEKTTFHSQKYNKIYNEYKKIADIIFITEINRKDIIELLEKANTKDEAFKNKIRHELYLKLISTYKLIKKYNLNQFHFHLATNESFLRLHKPSKFGDNLTNIRDTIAYLSKNQKSIDGYEVGRIRDGYRFGYPLFLNDTYVGGFEIVFSTLALNLDFTKNYQNETNFLVAKEEVERKVFQEEKKNFVQSQFKDYYFEKESMKILEQQFNNSYKSGKTSDKIIKIVDKGISKNVTIYDASINQMVTFLLVRNPVTQKIIGLFVIKSDAKYIKEQNIDFYLFIFLVNLLLTFILFFLYKNHQKNIKLKTIVEEADSGIGIIDLEGNFLEVNEMYSSLLGYEKQELLTKRCIDLTVVDESEKDILIEAKKNKNISKIKKVCIRKDGSLINLEFSIRLMPFSDEFIVIINSLEEKIKLEELNESLEKKIVEKIKEEKAKDIVLFQQAKLASMGEMVDAIAHQWINPLGVIKMYAQKTEMYLSLEPYDVKKIALFQNKIFLQVDHLVETISEFRNFFRPDTHPYEIEIMSVINSVLKLMKDELIKNCIEVEITGDRTLEINIIPNEFKHVLINLFNNSKDAFNERELKNRKITLHILKEDDFKILQITDNAGGIPEEILNHIFESNFTTKPEGKGTGIGLYMTKQIVEKIGGTIEVENVTCENQQGAMFVIKFSS